MARRLLLVGSAGLFVTGIEREIEREHAIIERVLDGAGLVVRRLRRGERVPHGLLRALQEFFMAFVAGVHHAKEEHILRSPAFAALAPVLVQEHARGRDLLAALVEAPTDPDRLEAYVRFKRDHIATEATLLTPLLHHLADDREAAEAVLRAFAAVDAELGSSGRLALFEMAGAIEAACRLESQLLVAEGGAARTVRDVMRTRVGTLTRTTGLCRATELMEALEVREVPVADEQGAVVGILTRGDLAPFRGQLEWATVNDAMTPNPMTIDAGAPLRDAASLLVRHCWNALPVLDGGRLVGMISRADVLRTLAGEPDRGFS